jgi:hypothetical protein
MESLTKGSALGNPCGIWKSEVSCATDGCRTVSVTETRASACGACVRRARQAGVPAPRRKSEVRGQKTE